MKDRIRELIIEYLRREHPELPAELLADSQEVGLVRLAPPRDPAHGDLASNAAMLAAGRLGLKPRLLAESLARYLNDRLAGKAQVEVAGPGFLNFRLAAERIQETLRVILAAGDAYGKSEAGTGEKIDIEFVSANPTGPPVIVSARAAAFGSTLARILSFCGYTVSSEYYLNDSGRQVRMLGASLRARRRELAGAELDIPEGGYHGLYLQDMARALPEADVERWDSLPEDEALDAYARHAVERLVAEVKREMTRFRSPFDIWFSERSLHESGKVDAAFDRFVAQGLVYEEDGAQWFRSSRFGDDKDRVLRKSDGTPTYFLADAAYHLDKLQRGYERAILVLGPDHHGHATRMQAIARAIGAPEDWLEILLLQWVTLVDGGEAVSMSKRAGDFVTMAELIDEVGVDVARTYFLTRRRDSHLEFDLGLAREQSSKSRIFYAQYATARIAGVLRKAAEAGISPWPDARLELSRLESEEELALIKLLGQFPEAVTAAGRAREPNRLFNYLVDLAAQFHKFYHEHLILGEDEGLAQARLGLCRASGQVLDNGLALMGVEAPERM